MKSLCPSTLCYTDPVMQDSKSFEQQIHRICELLERCGAQVAWDDHIPDPDNPSQPRQIDVTIRRDGAFTLVECRDHQSRQDVQWIEELIGRRASLRADAIIAVSSSGFTEGALSKSRQFGVIPRDLRKLTDREVEAWGRQVALTLYFYEYSDLELSLCFKRESVPKSDMDALKSEITTHPGLQSLFSAAAQQLGTLNLAIDERTGRTVEFGLRLQLDGFQLSGEPVVAVDFRGKAVLISKQVESPAVFVYEDANHSSTQRDAMLENFSLGEISIVHDASRISLFLDLSQIEMPPFCQFRFFRLAAQDEMDHEGVELAGLDRLWVKGGRMKINICSEPLCGKPF